MMGTALIRSISDHAAYKAAQEDKRPLFIDFPQDAPHIPFLGDYVPPGWRIATWADVTLRPRNAWGVRDDDEATFMVDASGWGSESEPALTVKQFTDYALGGGKTFAYAIREAGQFQVVVSPYIEDASSPGVPAPEVEPCDSCGEIHDPMEECDCLHEFEAEDIADGVVGGGMAHVWVRYCKKCGEEGEPEEPD